MTTARIRIKMGIAIKNMTASWGLIRNVIMIPPIHRRGNRTRIRSIIMTTVCTWTISLVSLVTRDEVLN
jgi:hypothetical protein